MIGRRGFLKSLTFFPAMTKATIGPKELATQTSNVGTASLGARHAALTLEERYKKLDERRKELGVSVSYFEKLLKLRKDLSNAEAFFDSTEAPSTNLPVPYTISNKKSWGAGFRQHMMYKHITQRRGIGDFLWEDDVALSSLLEALKK